LGWTYLKLLKSCGWTFMNLWRESQVLCLYVSGILIALWPAGHILTPRFMGNLKTFIHSTPTKSVICSYTWGLADSRYVSVSIWMYLLIGTKRSRMYFSKMYHQRLVHVLALLRLLQVLHTTFPQTFALWMLNTASLVADLIDPSIPILGTAFGTTLFTNQIELDDGKIETGNPYDLDGKKHGFRLRFSQQSQSIEPNVPFTGSTSLDQAAWSTGGARRLQNLRGWAGLGSCIFAGNIWQLEIHDTHIHIYIYI